MECPICHRYMKDGTFNNHHLWFPKAKFKGTRRGRITIPTHTFCHSQFHLFFLHYCMRQGDCKKCQYTKVCCYAGG